MLIGRRVRAARERLGLNQVDLARKAGVSPAYVNRLEIGRYARPSVEKLTAVAGVLGLKLADLTTDRLQAHTNLLLTRWARSHVHSWKSIISASLRAAVPRYLDHNPMTGVKLPKTQEQPPKAWTAQEVAALLRTAEGRAHEVWLWLSLGTGIRLGEARALLWSDVDVTNRTITVRHALDHTTDALGPTKSRKTRVIELPDELVPILVAHRVRQKPRERSVCTSSYSGTVPRPRTVHSWLQQLCADAGVTVLSPHSTRHTCASLMLSSGVPITEVSRILGHSSPAITMNFYAHFVDQGQRRGATAMGAVLVPKNGSETGPGTNIGARQTR